MFIETTFLRYGHGASGLIGKTLNENAVHRWGMKSQTTEAFNENTKSTHFQACVWKTALDEQPPNLDPLKFG